MDSVQENLLHTKKTFFAGSDTNAAALYVLDKIMVHEDYNSDTYKNDIAIVKTQNVIVYSERVGPMCLPFRYSTQDFTEEWVTALGWFSQSDN